MTVIVDVLNNLRQVLNDLGLEKLVKVKQDPLDINVVESLLFKFIIELLRLVRWRVYKIVKQFVMIVSRGNPIHKAFLSDLEIGGLNLVEDLVDFLHIKLEILVLVTLIRRKVVYVAILVKV